MFRSNNKQNSDTSWYRYIILTLVCQWFLVTWPFRNCVLSRLKIRVFFDRLPFGIAFVSLFFPFVGGCIFLILLAILLYSYLWKPVFACDCLTIKTCIDFFTIILSSWGSVTLPSPVVEIRLNYVS